MAKLIVNPTSSARREIPLARALLSIGRDPSNDVVLPDAMVSRRHAVIEFRASQYFIRDCNSSNGSLVNGDRVSERNLRDGDLVAIGTARLLFREELVGEEGAVKVVQHPSAPRLQCPACHADYRKGDVFCRQCGVSVAPSAPPKAVCASCGATVALPARFCNACGKALEGESPRAEATRPHPIPADPAPEPDPGPGPRESPPPSVPEPEPRPPVEAGAASPRASRIPATLAPPSAPLPGPRAVEPLGPRAVPPPWPRPLETRVPGDGHPHAAVSAVSTPEPAGFGARLAAGLIDAVVVAAGQTLVLAPAIAYWWSREVPRASSDVAFWPILLSLGLVPLALALGAAYYIYYWGVKGATPAKRLFDLAVQGEDGVQPIGLARASMRLLGYILSGALFGIGFLMIALGGSALHDRLAGTRVVRWRRT